MEYCVATSNEILGKGQCDSIYLPGVNGEIGILPGHTRVLAVLRKGLVLVAASGVVRDLYEKILKKGEVPDQKRMTLYSRLAVTSLVVLSVLLAIFVQDLVFWFVLFAWAGLGAAIGPTSILALFWKRTTRAGVIAGLLTGTVTVFVWKLTGLSKLIIYELIPGFVLAFLVTIIVSLLTRDK